MQAIAYQKGTDNRRFFFQIPLPRLGGKTEALSLLTDYGAETCLFVLFIAPLAGCEVWR